MGVKLKTPLQVQKGPFFVFFFRYSKIENSLKLQSLTLWITSISWAFWVKYSWISNCAIKVFPQVVHWRAKLCRLHQVYVWLDCLYSFNLIFENILSGLVSKSLFQFTMHSVPKRNSNTYACFSGFRFHGVLNQCSKPGTLAMITVNLAKSWLTMVPLSR